MTNAIDTFFTSGKKASFFKILKLKKSNVFGFKKNLVLVLSPFVFQFLILGSFMNQINFMNAIWAIYAVIALLSISSFVSSLLLQNPLIKRSEILHQIVSGILILQSLILLGGFFSDSIYTNISGQLPIYLFSFFFIVILSFIYSIPNWTQEFKTIYKKAVQTERVKKSLIFFYNLLNWKDKVHLLPVRNKYIIKNQLIPIKLI